MNIVTWNVNSLKARAEYFSLFLEKESPDVLCLQELKLQTDAVDQSLLTERGYDHLAIHGQKQWNGVLIASKVPFENVVYGLPDGDAGQSRFVAVDFPGFCLVNLYCPQGQNEDSDKYAYKLSFYDALIEWLSARKAQGGEIIVTGDLNIAPEACDVFWDTEEEPNIVTHHPKELEKWAQLIDLGFTDIGRRYIPEGGYTFWDYRGFWDFNARRFRYDKGMRIDHFLVTPNLIPQVSNVEVHRGWRRNRGKVKASDHAPVSMILQPAP